METKDWDSSQIFDEIQIADEWIKTERIKLEKEVKKRKIN